MGKIISIINQKGGVGKTTSAINLAASLAVAERQALLLDFDPQGNATSGLGVSVDQVQGKTVYQALVGQCKLEEAIRETELPGLWVVPADQNLSGAEVELVGAIAREQKLKKALEPIRDRFDYILIDCPPSLGLLTINALTASDSYLVPMQCEYFSLEGLSQLVSTAGLIQGALNPKLELEGILLTMFDSRNNLAHQVLEEVKRHFGDKLFTSVIPRNVKLSEAPSHGKPVLLYDIESKGAKAYLEVTKEMIERNLQKSRPAAVAAAAPAPAVAASSPEPAVEAPATEMPAAAAALEPAPSVEAVEAAVLMEESAAAEEAAPVEMAAEESPGAPEAAPSVDALLEAEASAPSQDLSAAAATGIEDEIAIDVNTLGAKIAEISAEEVALATDPGEEQASEEAIAHVVASEVDSEHSAAQQLN